MTYGLVIDKIRPEDYVFGDALLGDAPINADWSQFLPSTEVQNLFGVEPYACASFATLNCVETLLRQEYANTENYSDRFLASVSGTAALRGNSPHTVAETLRKEGCALEKDYPFEVNTFDQYYSPVPETVRGLAKQFVSSYSFGHSYVPLAPQDLMNALTYSPLGFSVCAWHKDGDLYYRPEGGIDNHFVMCYGYEVGKYWKIFDSYSNDGTVLKKVRWDAIPMQAKRYTLNKRPATYLFLQNLWYQMTDPEVAHLQRALRSLGYAIPNGITTFYGKETRNAVWKFQIANGIDDDGAHCGIKTRTALNRALNPNLGAIDSLILTVRTVIGI